MGKMRKIGVILILVGFFMPLVLFFLSTGYRPETGLLGNVMWKDGFGIMELHVWTVAKKETLIVSRLTFFDKYTNKTDYSKYILKNTEETEPFLPWRVISRKERITIPYRYVLAGGIVLIFLGTGIITLSKVSKYGET